jgi:hypothetical protein
VFIHDLLSWAGQADEDREIGIIVRSIETSENLTTTYDIAADISEYGELMLRISIEGEMISIDSLQYPQRFNSMRKRRNAVKFIIIMLELIRDAQMRALDNTPDNLRYSDKYEYGEFAVEAIEEAIDKLADAC